MSLNKWLGIGRITKDIQLQITQSRKQYAQFTLAVDNGKDPNGNDRPADFITCVAWDKKAENLSVYVHKGNRIAIEGRLRVEVYPDPQEPNKNKYKTYVLVQNFNFLENKTKDNFIPQEPDYIKEEQTNVREEDPFEKFGQEVESETSDLNLPW